MTKQEVRYGGSIRPRDVSAWEMASLFRQLRGNVKSSLLWVRTIENAYRLELGLVQHTDDAIVVAALFPAEGQTAAETAGARVIRACIGIREHAEKHGEVDQGHIAQLIGFLHDADPDRALGSRYRAGHRAAGAKTAEQAKAKAKKRDASITAAALEIRKTDPTATQKTIAITLEERGLGTWKSLLKKLPRRKTKLSRE